jgi:hypothetical protein
MDVLLPFLQSTPGKMLRVVMGLTVVAFGTLVIQDTVGFLVAVIGLIPLFAALSGECLIAPSLGTHLRGTRRHIRNTKCSQFPKHAGEAERFSYAWQPSPGSRAGDDRYLGTLVFLRSLSLVRSRFRSKRKSFQRGSNAMGSAGKPCRQPETIVSCGRGEPLPVRKADRWGIERSP